MVIGVWSFHGRSPPIYEAAEGLTYSTQSIHPEPRAQKCTSAPNKMEKDPPMRIQKPEKEYAILVSTVDYCLDIAMYSTVA